VIETGGDVSSVDKWTYRSGEKVPNYTLLPGDDLDIKGSPLIVDKPTLLSDLLTPGKGDCKWAACRYSPNSDARHRAYDIEGVIDSKLKEWYKKYE